MHRARALVATLVVTLVVVVVLAARAAAEEPLPPGAVVRLGGAALRQEGWVSSVAFAPDGKTFASGSQDMSVRIFDAATGAALRTLRGHESYVEAVAFSPDGKRIASASYDTTCRVWDAATGAELKKLEGPKAFLTAVAFSPDGELLAVLAEGSLLVFDATSYEKVRTVELRASSNVAFSPDGKTIACGAALLEAASGKKVADLAAQGDVRAVAFAPDGKTVATGTMDGALRLHDAATGKETAKVAMPKGIDVASLAFAPDGKTIAAATADAVRVLDASTLATARTMGQTKRGRVPAVAFSPDGKTIASAGTWIDVWDAATGARAVDPPGPRDAVSSVAFSRDGKAVAVGSLDGSARVFELPGGTETWKLRDHQRGVTGVAFAGEGTLVTGSLDRSVRLTPLGKGEAHSIALGDEYAEVVAVSASADGKTIACGAKDHSVRVFSLEKGAETRKITHHKGKLIAVALSPDGELVASTSQKEKVVRIADARTGEERRAVDLGGPSPAVAFAPDGKTIAAATRKGVRVIDAASGETVKEIAVDAKLAVTSLAFAADGKTLAAGTADLSVESGGGQVLPGPLPEALRRKKGKNPVLLVDVGAGTVRAKLEGHEQPVVAVAVSPDGKLVASGSQDGTALVWTAP